MTSLRSLLPAIATVATAALAATALLLASGPSLAGTLSPYGVNVHAPEGTEQTVIYGAVADASIGWVRIDFSWSQSEPAKGVFDWSVSDAVVAGAVSRGLRVFATVVGTPAWATAGDPERGVPRSAADWADFCARAAARYRDTIPVWGIWNEANRPEAFAGTRQEYIDVLLIPGADAIHAANPGALVAGPETAHTVSSNSNWYRWLQDTIVQAGDRLDVVTHHVYDSGSDAGVTKKLNASTAFGGNPNLWDVVNPSVREVLQQTGWYGRAFWLTETGWASDQVGEANQAAYTTGLLGTWFGASAPNRWVERVFVYEIKDDGNEAVPRWGILRTDGSRKPAWTAYRDFIAANLPAGDDADLVTETVPASMVTGSTADVTVRLRNSGSTTWSGKAGYKLAALDDAGSLGPGRVVLPVETVPPGGEALFSFRLNAAVPAGVYQASWRMLREGSGTFGAALSRGVTVAGECPAPAAPVPFQGPAATVRSGSAVVFSWTGPTGSTSPAAYRYELAPSPSFASPSASGSTTGTSAVFPTDRGAEADLSFRVRGVSGCGQAGPWSATVGARVARSAGPFVAVGVEGLPMLARPGTAPGTATVRYRNAGPVAAFLRFQAVGSLFVPSPSFLYVQPGQEAAVTVAAAPVASAAQGLFRETLTAAWDTGTVTTELFLAVTDARTPGRIAVDRSSVRILATPGGTGEASLSVTNASAATVALAANVSPAGAWLRFDAADLARPLAPGETRPVKLTADRARWSSADVPPPARTVLTLAPAGGTEADGAAVEVLHVEVPPSETVGARPPVRAGGSFFLPTAVHAAGAFGQLFTSYGWIRNLGSDAASVDLYAVRQGEDGRTATRVTQSIPALTALPLVDFIQTLFGADSFPAAVEVRSAASASLAVRTTARGEKSGGTPYETEIPVTAAWAATGGGDAPLVLAGVKATPNFRTNVILAETSGSAARVALRLFDWTGKERASVTADVPPLGSVQFPLAETLGVASFEAASLSVEPVSGAGRVTAIGTVIDNDSASFSVVTGVPSAPRPAEVVVIPSIVHARGNGSYFTTDLSIANVTLAPVTLRLVYAYAGTDALGAVVSGESVKDVTIAARGSLPIGQGNDVIRRLFLFSPESNTSGTLRITGATSSIVARAVVSTPVDLLDATKGTKSAEFGGYSASSPEAVSGTSGFVLYPGLDKNDRERVNLILTEVAGGNATVKVRLLSAVEGGLLGERTFSLSAYQKVQVNDLWNGPDGFALGTFPQDRVMVTLEGAGTGSGRVVGALTPVENASNSPRILPLAPPAPPVPFR